ncbi:MAG: helix-turn-helix domain-containing protein [Nocardioides sp.]
MATTSPWWVVTGAWDGRSLVVGVCSDRALISPAGALLFLQLLDHYGRQEGVPYSPAVERMSKVLTPIARHTGHPDVQAEVDHPQWPHDEIGTTQAAELLGCSREHAGRLARTEMLGPHRLVGGRRLVSKAQVIAYAEIRRADNDSEERHGWTTRSST